jgi:dTDP-4-amino-4,6-dideoxygalactose transaminase
VTVAIPLTDLASQHAALQAPLNEAIQRVISSGRYILGPEVAGFERAFADYLGVAYAVGVSSGTSALQLALMALGIGPDSEVITVSHTAVATVAAVAHTGAAPVLVDNDPTRYTMDPARLASALSAKTRAIVPVHLYGCPAEMAPILSIARQHGLRVIEDCAQAHGARYCGQRVGTLGDLGIFSFYPTKNLGAMGDGGAIVTNDAGLAERVRELREYGWRQRYVSEVNGLNARLDELQAAILSVKLPHLDRWNIRRRDLARRYQMILQNTSLQLPAEPPDSEAVFHQYVVRTPHRDSLRAHLAHAGIASGVLYPVPVHLQPAFLHLRRGAEGLANAELIAAQNLALPSFPELRDEAVERIGDVIRGYEAPLP